MALAVAAQAHEGAVHAKDFLNAPGGFAHAALSAAHVPVYTLTPLTEFFHKVVALALTLMLTFGTYAAVDPAYARFAANSVRESVDAALDSYHAATGGGLNELANRTQAQVAAAAENPAGTFASIASAFQRTASNLARALNTGINDALYAVSFPRSLTEQSVVAIEVVPSIRKATPTPTTSPSTTPRAIASGPVNQTIINNPVIERVVETTRLVTAGGISEELLDKKIADLDAKLSSRAMVSSAANTTNITNIYSSAASVGRIEHLDELDLTHPTISNAHSLSVTGATELSSLTASGETSLATTTITGDLSVTGAFTLASLTTTNITATNATTTNATSTNFFSTNASTTNATSTNFFSVLGRFTTGIIDTLTATIVNITTLTATNLTATNATTTSATTTNLTIFGTAVAPYFTATSTTASVLPYASSTALTVSGHCVTADTRLRRRRRRSDGSYE